MPAGVARSIVPQGFATAGLEASWGTVLANDARNTYSNIIACIYSCRLAWQDADPSALKALWAGPCCWRLMGRTWAVRPSPRHRCMIRAGHSLQERHLHLRAKAIYKHAISSVLIAGRAGPPMFEGVSGAQA